METKYKKSKWISLISFSLMYNLVYIGRFNVNNFIDDLAREINISDGQQDLLLVSIFLSYALGSFINGYLADRLGAKKIVVLGGVMTCALNISITFQNNWQLILVIWIINGFFQSMIWVGGISLLAKWWKIRERGKSIGIANFFSGLSHATAYLIPIMLCSIYPYAGWRLNFIAPMILLLAFVLLFAFAAVEAPENLKVSEDKLKVCRVGKDVVSEKKQLNYKYPWKMLFTGKKFLVWCSIAMLSSICRYGLLNWIPLYYEHYTGGPVISEMFLSLALPIGMAFGTLIITWMTGSKFYNNKGLIICALAAMCGTLIIVFPMLENTHAILIGIFFTGFVLYGINGVLWIVAIDYGEKYFAGSAAGVLNGFAYLGAGLEGWIFSLLLYMNKSYLTIFIFMEILCIGMIIFGVVVAKKDTNIVPEIGVKD